MNCVTCGQRCTGNRKKCDKCRKGDTPAPRLPPVEKPPTPGTVQQYRDQLEKTANRYMKTDEDPSEITGQGENVEPLK